MGLVVLLGLAWAGVGVISKMVSRGTTTTASSGTAQVVYTISGSSEAGTITYSTASGIEQADAAPPWTRTITVPNGTPVTVSAQNGSEFGSVTCSINVDGVVISSNTSTADYGVASCDGLAR